MIEAAQCPQRFGCLSPSALRRDDGVCRRRPSGGTLKDTGAETTLRALAL